jgi:hypothetical protein
MLRRNFLRNAALTLPVALIAPEALLASNQSSAQEAAVILVGSDAATQQVAERLAANKTLSNGPQATTLTHGQVKKVICTKDGFLLTDGQGKTYSSRKVIFSGDVSFCDTSAKVHVATGIAQKITLSIKKNGHNSATCWMAPVNGADDFLLSSFANSKKVAFMCLS